jgi:two-component system, chemotaxis family, chemotaxis protein CheY
LKILIADDDYTSRLTLQAMLKGYGDTYLAADGSGAIAAVKASLAAGAPYDLICLDVTMPMVSGQAALVEIRRLEQEAGGTPPPRARVVMTTGHADTDTVRNAIREGCDGYVVKPYEQAVLLEQLRRFFDPPPESEVR